MNDIDEAVRQYQALCEGVPLKEIRSEAEYDAAVAVLNKLLDAGGADENHPLAELVNALGLFVSAYENGD